MVDHEHILKGMEVVDVAELHVGVVEHHAGAGFKLSHRDAPDHHHHYVPLHWVARLDHRVHLSRGADDVFDSWPGGYPSKRPELATPHEPSQPVNWKAWGAAGAGAIGVLLMALL